MRIEQFESKDDLIQELTLQIKDTEYKFLDERQELNNRILKLQREIEVEKEKYAKIENKYSNVKQDLNMIEKINEKQNEELENETMKGEIVNTLREKIFDLSSKIEKLTDELIQEKDLNLDMKLELREKELEIKREEVRSDELTKEIEFLEMKVQEWEEKYDNDKIQGNAHIGLSRIDFMAVNALDKNSQRNSLKKSYLYTSAYQGGGSKNKVSRPNSIRKGKESFDISEEEKLHISEASRRLESSEHNLEISGLNLQINVPPNNPGLGSMNKNMAESPLQTPGKTSTNLKVPSSNTFKKKTVAEVEDEDEKPIPIFGANFDIGAFESQIMTTDPDREKGNERIERNLDNIVPESLMESAIVSNEIGSHQIFSKNRNVGMSEKSETVSRKPSVRRKITGNRLTFDKPDRYSQRSSTNFLQGKP